MGKIIIALVVPLILGSSGSINSLEVYSSTPDWISENPHYSTGAALADLDKNGWLDLIIADGNDMKPGRVNVYYNRGTLPTIASWQSEDLGYNGHIDVADVNGDGWLDVAVSYLGEFNTIGPIARVYLNNKGILSSLPDWSSNIKGNAFAVAFGDVNNDGRPDLAVATGWCYSPERFYHNYLYLNKGGTLEKSPSWKSQDKYHSFGALWLDANKDGWLDLALIGAGQETRIYYNKGGTLERRASWQTSDSSGQFGIMLTAGDVNMDGLPDLFATDNIQLGGTGLFKQYNGIAGGFETTYSWNYYGGYGSAVALADVNGDNLLDLATGSWWGYTHIFCNKGKGLPNSPSWTSKSTSVVEKIVFGDVGPSLCKERTFSEIFTTGQLFYLSHQPIQGIVSISRDGVELEPHEYTFNREHGWVTINAPPKNEVEVVYTYSRSIDMIISNWDSHIGNFLYYNQLFKSELECNGSLKWRDIKTNQRVEGSFTIQNIGEPRSELHWRIESYPEWGKWNFEQEEGKLTPEQGKITVRVSVIAPMQKNKEFDGEIRIINLNDNEDFGVIPVYLTTSKLLKIERPPLFYAREFKESQILWS